jgi:parallel beta-helix repeat protein
VVLSWQASIYTGGPALTGYKVYRGSSSGTETLLATVGTATVHTDTPLQNGETYYYKVSALNIVGEGARSAGYSVTTFDVPAIPMNLTLTPSDGQIHMEWQSPADDGGTPITNYTIYRGNSSGNEDYLITLGPVLNHTDISLTNGLTYYYKLSASNNVGEGLLSAEASAAPSATVISPSEPRNLAAFPGYRNVTLSWDPPSNNGGSAVTNYTIYRGTASGGETHLATIGNMLNYFDPMLSDGQQYYYKVSASNIAGEGAMSSETSVTTFAVPDAPDLTAIPTNSSVLLEWQPGGDGGSPVTGYEIYRGAVSGNLSHLASVGAVLFYNDGNLTNFQNYYYAVSAVNMVGEGAQSTETLAIPAPPVHNLDTNEYFDSIQGAIDDADTLNGHTITVMAGVFLEQVQIHKSLTVIGAGLDKCFIDADFVFTDFVVNISVDWVNLTGFTVRHCVFDENDPVGIKVDGEQCTVSDCCISDNEAKAIVSYRSNNTMMNNTITNNTGGIYIFGNDTSVLDNIMVNNSSGINIVNSCRSIIKRNSMVGGGISIDGGALENWNTHTIDTSNTVNGRPVQYWKDQNGGTVPAGAGQVLLANCMNVVVEGQGFDGVGLFIGFSGGSTIQGNNISHSQYGIFLQSSTGNTISGNNASDNENGIYLLSSGSNNVTSNTVNGNSGYGIYLSSSGGSSVQNNVIVNNKWGICLSASVTCHIANNTVAMNAIHGIFLSASSNSNIVLNNTVSDNNYGIFLALSSSNTIHHCNFVSNVNQAYDPHSNQWDDGSEGNYWSDYAGVDSEPNGIGDTPYAIPGGPNQDRYPLMVPWT